MNLNSSVIKERQNLGESGFANIAITVDRKNKNIIGRPSLISRGAFYVKTSLSLVNEAKELPICRTLLRINTENFNVME